MVQSFIIVFVGVSANLAQTRSGTLLFSLDRHESGSQAPATAPEGLQIIIRHFSDDQAGGPFLDLGAGAFWQNGSSGVVDFTTTNAPGFLQWVNLASNGVDESVDLLVLSHLGGGGSGNSERGWGFGEPDLFGNNIDRVRLVVHQMTIDPYDLPLGQGLAWDTDFTWEFWGSPVPEPSALVLLCIAIRWGRTLERNGSHRIRRV